MTTATVPTFALYGEQQNARPDFWVHCETIAARSSAHHWEIKRHRHESLFQLLYIWDGAGDVVFEKHVTLLGPSGIVTIPPGIVHGFRFSRDVQGLVITVVADHLPLTAHMGKRPADWLAQPQVLSLAGSEDGGYIHATLHRIAEELQAPRRGRNDIIEAYLTTVLMLVGRITDADAFALAPDNRLARVEMLKDLIARNFRDHYSAAHYARLLNLSPAHLNRVVREVTGLTVHDLVASRLFEEARRALVFSSASVQQIADMLGFSDPAYFVRAFKRRTGQTPGTFRRSEREKLSIR
jgi:AraC family transcriptional activator of pobA